MHYGTTTLPMFARTQLAPNGNDCNNRNERERHNAHDTHDDTSPALSPAADLNSRRHSPQFEGHKRALRRIFLCSVPPLTAHRSGTVGIRSPRRARARNTRARRPPRLILAQHKVPRAQGFWWHAHQTPVMPKATHRGLPQLPLPPKALCLARALAPYNRRAQWAARRAPCRALRTQKLPIRRSPACGGVWRRRRGCRRTAPAPSLIVSHQVVQLRRAVLVVTALFARTGCRRRHGCLRGASPELPHPKIWWWRSGRVRSRRGVLQMMGEATRWWWFINWYGMDRRQMQVQGRLYRMGEC